MVPDIIFFFVCLLDFPKMGFHQLNMLRQGCEVNITILISGKCIIGRFSEVFSKSGPCLFAVCVERDQCFRQIPVFKALIGKHSVQDFLIPALLHDRLKFQSPVFHRIQKYRKE